MPETSESKEFMDLSPFENIDFAGIHRQVTEALVEEAKKPKRAPIVGKVDPNSRFYLSIRLGRALDKEVRKAGGDMGEDGPFNTLENLPSLFDPEKWGEDFMEILRERRKSWMATFARIEENMPENMRKIDEAWKKADLS